jgi:hypothetical protein
MFQKQKDQSMKPSLRRYPGATATRSGVEPYRRRSASRGLVAVDVNESNRIPFTPDYHYLDVVEISRR